MSRRREALALALLLIGCREQPPLPEMMELGDWSLVDQTGENFGSAELRGRVWIADFVFTSCPDVCPLMTSQMANVSRRLDDPQVRFVSISVDPEHDTPERLRAYAARHRADPERWRFLTGTRAQIETVVIERFRHHVGEREARGEGYAIMHGVRFVLVDRRGFVRGLYETDAAGIEGLERDVARLLEEGG